jgi:hypothetical protein
MAAMRGSMTGYAPCHLTCAASSDARYRRPKIEGLVFFFTLTLADRGTGRRCQADSFGE